MRERPVNGKVRTTFAFYALPHAEKHAALGNVLSREALVRNTVSSNFCGHSQTRRGTSYCKTALFPTLSGIECLVYEEG